MRLAGVVVEVAVVVDQAVAVVQVRGVVAVVRKNLSIVVLSTAVEWLRWTRTNASKTWPVAPLRKHQETAQECATKTGCEERSQASYNIG